MVARMRAAGAVMLGKTNVPVLSHPGTNADDSWAGPTLNVPMPSRVPGGSSAGTAAAVGAAMAVLGLAEETGGSIQNPASAQDLVGLKPTIGLVPNAGVMPLSGNRDVVGPIALLRARRGAVPGCAGRLHGRGSEDARRRRQEAGRGVCLAPAPRCPEGRAPGPIRPRSCGPSRCRPGRRRSMHARRTSCARRARSLSRIRSRDRASPNCGSPRPRWRTSMRGAWNRCPTTCTSTCSASARTRRSRPSPSSPRRRQGSRRSALAAC